MAHKYKDLFKQRLKQQFMFMLYMYIELLRNRTLFKIIIKKQLFVGTIIPI